MKKSSSSLFLLRIVVSLRVPVHRRKFITCVFRFLVRGLPFCSGLESNKKNQKKFRLIIQPSKNILTPHQNVVWLRHVGITI